MVEDVFVSVLVQRRVAFLCRDAYKVDRTSVIRAVPVCNRCVGLPPPLTSTGGPADKVGQWRRRGSHGAMD